MTILQQNSGGFNGTGSFTVSLPAASSSANTVVVVVAGNTTVTTPSGWTLRTSQVNFMGHYLYDRAGGAQSWTFSFAGTGSLTWWVAEIPGTAPTYVGATSSNASSADTSYSTPGLTPTAGTRLLLASLASVTSGATVRTLSGWTAGFVEQADVCQPTQDYPMQGVAALDNVTANGSTAYSTTGTFSGSSTGRSAIIGAYTTTAGGGGSAFTGSAGLSGAGTLTASGSAAAASAGSLTGAGSLTPSAGPVAVSGAAALSGAGTLSATSSASSSGAAPLTGSGALSAAGFAAASGTASLTGSGTLAASGTVGGTVPADPAIGTVGTASTSSGNTTTSTNRALASTVTGDLNIIPINVSPLANTTDPGVPTIDGTPISTTVGGVAGGWTTIGTSWDTGSPGPRLTIVGRVRQAGDPTSVTIAWASAGNHAANVFSIPAGGFDTSAAGSWLEAAAIQPQTPSAATFATPNLTTAHRGRLFAVYSNRTAGGPWTDSQGTLVTSAQSTSSANFALFDEGVQDPATFTRTGTWTAATSVGNAAIFMIRSGVSTGSNYSGTGSLSGTGTLTASGTATSPGSINLTGVGTLAAAGTAAVTSTATFAGVGTLSGASATAIQQWLALPGKRFCGHRDGFYATYGEFTIAGFTALLNYNPTVAWNIDVFKTSDNEWVASHDQTTGRVLSGTSLDIPSSTWAAISPKTTLVGGNPVARLDDIVAIAPAGTIFFVDNKQGTNNSAFIAKLNSLGLTPANTVHKSYIAASSSLTAMRSAGYLNWGYAFDTTSDMSSLASNNGLCDWIGFDYAGSQASWNTVIGYGKPSFAHILPNQTAQNTADTKAANAGGSNFGYMVSNVSAVVPQTGYSGSGLLTGTGTLTASGSASTASGTGSLTGSGTLSASGTATASGAAALTGAGSLTASGSAATSGAAALSGAGVLTVTSTPKPAGTGALTGSGTLTASGSASVTGVAALTGLGTLTASSSGNGAGSISLSGLGVLAATVSQVTATGTATLGGNGSLGATGRASTTGTAPLTGSGLLTVTSIPATSGTGALTGAGTLLATSSTAATGTAALTGTGTLAAVYVPPPDPDAVLIRSRSRVRFAWHDAKVRFTYHRGEIR